ncbi:hypothetical protein PIB30_074270 [Stylosanthes scabra]|uniref:Cytochrome P450 n=1 Tax=Stylosanthes scabra TaxID=79078 RepID=A0ABU6UNG2_9FABA|nr:hypothetical protein [Stylosanthes scabra]
MGDYMLKTMGACFSFLLVVYGMIKLVNEIWWRPKRMEKMLRKKGIKGSSYGVINGDISVMNEFDRVASSKAIALNHQIVTRVFPFYNNMIQQYGEVSLSWFGKIPRLIIGDNKLVRSILLNKNGHIRKPPRSPLVKLLGIGLTSLEGDIWTQRRKAVSPAFLHDELKALVPSTFGYSCSARIDRWLKLVEEKGSCEVDANLEFDVLTGDVIARGAFGSSYQEGKKIFDLLYEIRLLVNEANNSIYIPGFRLGRPKSMTNLMRNPLSSIKKPKSLSDLETASNLVCFLNPAPLVALGELSNPYLAKLCNALSPFSHKPPAFCLGTSDYVGSPETHRKYILYIFAICGDLSQRDRFTMVNQDEEGVAYTDHSGDGQRRDRQPECRQEELGLNATANDITGNNLIPKRTTSSPRCKCGFGRSPKRTTSSPRC